jgi:metallophosphoesterase (TIGR00282 family)
MKILAIGDVVGRCGRNALMFHLPEIIDQHEPDFIIANGENASHGRGLSEEGAQTLFDSGIDVITMGNHTFGNRDIYNLLRFEKRIIRPINYPKGTAGQGYGIFEKNGIKIAVINALGRVYMDPMDSPFSTVMDVLEEIKEHTDIILVDFHAEATSEKIAFSWYVDGMVSAVFGTHTHVQTADERISSKGTAYISDLGMTGAFYSVLGMERKVIIDRFVTGMPSRFELADGMAQINAALFTIDESTGKSTQIERIFMKY